MEVLIPFVALSGMYIINNRTTNESFENSDNTNDSNIPLKVLDTIDKEEEHYVNNNYEGQQTTDAIFNNSHVPVEFNSMNGEKISKDDFTHNNMVPFFGAKIKGNYDRYNLNENILDNMNGTGSLMKKKEERAPLFSPHENMNYANGAPNMNDFYQSRVNPSMKMNNIKPWKEERVAPGLNQGYTTNGACGLNSALDERETFMPKSVDELRVSTNPKQTYCLSGHEGPAASHIKERGHYGKMEKHLPDTYYENSPDRYFTTTGVESKPTARAVNVNKVENRTTTTREYEGVARGQNHINYSKDTYTPSNTNQLGQEQFTPAGANDKYNPTKSDFGAKSYVKYNNNRNTNRNNNGFGILGSALGAVVAPLVDVLKPSRKENVIGNVRLHGDVCPTHPNSYLKNQSAIRVTNRQMHPETLNHQNIQKQGEGGYELENNTVVPTNRYDTSTYYSGTMGGSGLNYGVSTYDAAYNQTNNDMKEATSVFNRIPQGNTQMFNQLNSETCVVKKETDRENNRMWVPSTNPLTLPPSTETCGVTNDPPYTGENNRLEPDLLQAFKENPYTHSLNSVA